MRGFRAAAEGRHSHSVAGENSLAALAKPRPVLLKASLNRSIIPQFMPAKATCVPPACCLLLRRAHMVLREAWQGSLHQTDRDEDNVPHELLPRFCRMQPFARCERSLAWDLIIRSATPRAGATSLAVPNLSELRGDYRLYNHRHRCDDKGADDEQHAMPPLSVNTSACWFDN
jgi:hypothetical protein